jgi:metal-responsive CopG/Arc/MetJ family transcriptional regulator
MATMNFSIPDDVKERFNQTFVNSNKSAIVAQLLEDAIERAERKQRSDLAIKRILAIRKSNTPASTKAILRARDEIRTVTGTAQRRIHK